MTQQVYLVYGNGEMSDFPPPLSFLYVRNYPKRFLDAQGLYVPGLFRVPGNMEIIRDLKARFDSGDHVEFDERVSVLQT